MFSHCQKHPTVFTAVGIEILFSSGSHLVFQYFYHLWTRKLLNYSIQKYEQYHEIGHCPNDRILRTPMFILGL
jgi:hypothetical protein